MVLNEMERVQNLLSLSLLVGFVLSSNQTANAQQLRWKFAKGDRFAVEMRQSLLQATEVNGKKLSNDIYFVLKMNWDVQQIDKDGNAVMQQTFTGLVVSWQPTGQEKMTFDSSNEKPLRGVEKRISNSLMPIMRSKFEVVMSPRGDIVSVEPDRETMDLLRAAPDSMEIRKLFTSEGISSTLSSSALVFPEEESKSWKEEDVVETPNSTSTYTRNFTIAGEEEKEGRTLTKIDIAGDVKFKQDFKENKARREQKVVKNNQTGEIYFDQETGNIVESSLSQEIATETPYRDIVLYANTKSSLLTKIKRVQ